MRVEQVPGGGGGGELGEIEGEPAGLDLGVGSAGCGEGDAAGGIFAEEAEHLGSHLAGGSNDQGSFLPGRVCRGRGLAGVGGGQGCHGLPLIVTGVAVQRYFPKLHGSG